MPMNNDWSVSLIIAFSLVVVIAAVGLGLGAGAYADTRVNSVLTNMAPAAANNLVNVGSAINSNTAGTIQLTGYPTRGFLYNDGTGLISTGTGSGTGNVTGPAAATTNTMCLFNGNTGTLIKGGTGVTYDSNNNTLTVPALISPSIALVPGASNNYVASVGFAFPGLTGGTLQFGFSRIGPVVTVFWAKQNAFFPNLVDQVISTTSTTTITAALGNATWLPFASNSYSGALCNNQTGGLAPCVGRIEVVGGPNATITLVRDQVNKTSGLQVWFSTTYIEGGSFTYISV